MIVIFVLLTITAHKSDESVTNSQNKNSIPITKPVTVTKAIINDTEMIGNTNQADWQALKEMDDRIIKDKNITMASCKDGDTSDNASSNQQMNEQYQHNTSNDMLDAQNQRDTILKKLGYNQVTPTQAQYQTLQSTWQNLKSLDDQAFDTYVDEYGLCVTVQGDLSYGDLQSAQEDKQKVNSDSANLEKMNFQRADLLKKLGYSDKDARRVIMGGVYF